MKTLHHFTSGSDRSAWWRAGAVLPWAMLMAAVPAVLADGGMGAQPSVASMPGQSVQPLPGALMNPLPGQIVRALPGELMPPLPGQIVRALPGEMVRPLYGQMTPALAGTMVRAMPRKASPLPPKPITPAK